MAPSKIMIIRHAEKPSKDGTLVGVGEDGGGDPDDLIIRGWQRAGALARYFWPLHGHDAGSIVQKPDFIVAAKAEVDTPSRRPLHTVTPLAALSGLVPMADFAPGQEAEAAQAILQQAGIGLVCWEHHNIALLIAAIVADGTVIPPHWKGDRFDVVLVLDRVGDGWSLTQVPQLLLAGDRDEPLPPQRPQAAPAG